METMDGRQAVYATSREEWRKWLDENSQTEVGVWLIQYHKKSKVPCISLIDATEEALCFGWIDSKAKKRNDESFYLTFTPRKAKSKWSKPNIERAERMMATGLMTKHGLEKIELAKRTGMWVEE
ncbi:hypothetical protein DVR12_00490 [Chitinophaga silvatica]|uniref:Bacteriocin-protection protein n=1 Tax=Chitinophaga silvatica TaxID=2282649 RepID=A0A3E1YFX5_9BACT|nr:hypothetical protein [Chitinophaga silvatica]RFS26303.1 hypothetical protein DVR12_00490 [Chitinophaga silvatica]